MCGFEVSVTHNHLDPIGLSVTVESSGKVPSFVIVVCSPKEVVLVLDS